MQTFLDLFSGMAMLLWLIWPFVLLVAFSGVLKGRGGLAKAAKQVLALLCLIWGLLAAARLWLAYTGETVEPILAEAWFWLVGGLLLLAAAGWFTWRWRRERQRLMVARSLAELRAMPPADFERLVAETYRAFGSRAQVVGASGDHGVDLVVTTPQGQKTIVQCKRYSGKVGEPVVRDLLGAMQHEQAEAGALITTGEFTAQARAWAQGKPIQLYDGPGFLNLLQTAQARRGRKAASPAQAAGQPAATASPRPAVEPAAVEHLAAVPPPLVQPELEPTVYPTAQVPACAECGAPMILRAARRGPNAGLTFWGCSTYPRCRGTRPLD